MDRSLSLGRMLTWEMMKSSEKSRQLCSFITSLQMHQAGHSVDRRADSTPIGTLTCWIRAIMRGQHSTPVNRRAPQLFCRCYTMPADADARLCQTVLGVGQGAVPFSQGNGAAAGRFCVSHRTAVTSINCPSNWPVWDMGPECAHFWPLWTLGQCPGNKGLASEPHCHLQPAISGMDLGLRQPARHWRAPRPHHPPRPYPGNECPIADP